MRSVLIIGAGISGLTAAYYLRQQGCQVLVLEAASRIGGLIATVKNDDYLLELGPNTTLSKPALSDMVAALRLEPQFAQAQARNRFLVGRGAHGLQLNAAPLSLRQAVTTPILSTKGKLRILREPFVGRGNLLDESVSAFMTRRFGAEITKEIVAAVLSGVWAADIEQLSCRSALRAVWEIEQEFGNLTIGGIRYARRRRKTKAKSPRARIMSFADGLEALPRALQEAIGAQNFRIGCRVDEVELGPLGVKATAANESFAADAAVIALPARETAALIGRYSKRAATALDELPASPVGVLHLSFAREDVAHALDGFGFLWSPERGRALLGTLFSSTLFPGRAASQRHLVTCMCGGGVNPALADVRDEALQARVIAALRPLIGARSEPQVLRATFWERAIPSYPLGHHLLEDEVRRLEEQDRRLSFIGNWRDGISVADCVAAGQLAALRIGRR